MHFTFITQKKFWWHFFIGALRQKKWDWNDKEECRWVEKKVGACCILYTEDSRLKEGVEWRPKPDVDKSFVNLMRYFICIRRISISTNQSLFQLMCDSPWICYAWKYDIAHTYISEVESIIMQERWKSVHLKQHTSSAINFSLSYIAPLNNMLSHVFWIESVMIVMPYADFTYIANILYVFADACELNEKWKITWEIRRNALLSLQVKIFSSNMKLGRRIEK